MAQMFKTLLISVPLLGSMMTINATELDVTLAAALVKKGTNFHPRTSHLTADGRPQYTNRLILEDSPYLLQHANNPVNWYAWGAEAFAAAKREHKPIFLSIGYSTCHWCHVMEHESFDNIAVAKLMNQYFINIKVDREQRPDIDETYMTAVSLMTGRGGWPMSSFITPEGKTFWGGTYIPPEQFKQLLIDVHGVWQNQHDKVEQQAEQVAAAVAKVNKAKNKSAQINALLIKQATQVILTNFDPIHGGFSPAPKFPNESELFLLLDQTKRTGNKTLLHAVEVTLNAMAQGGIYDQVGGGFHRYSTDNQWLVPHFEKMLYNQAHLSRVYLQAYELTQNPFYARIARQTLDYVLREMTAEKGGFYSASDADSDGKEGSFYIWTPTEIKTTLTPDDASLAISLFGVTKTGNFEGKNILYLPQSLATYADNHQLETADLLNKIDAILDTLRKARAQRVPPFRDDKIITAWNGMMISSLVEASQLLNEPRYLNAAKKNANFLWQSNRTRDDNLWRVHLEGNSSIKAVQEDYAYLAEGLIALYDATQNSLYLSRAEALTNTMITQFWDNDDGGFFMGAPSTLSTMARSKQSSDGAIPSGNSVALNVLAMLSRRKASLDYETKAKQTLSTFSEQITAYPSAYSYMLLGANKVLAGETSTQQYAAKGAVSIHARIETKGQQDKLVLAIKIHDGWHINANNPLDKELVPTTLKLTDTNTSQLQPIIYPKAIEKKLGFSQQPLALYEGDIEITAPITKIAGSKKNILPVELSLQACNHLVCLAPEVITFKLMK